MRERTMMPARREPDDGAPTGGGRAVRRPGASWMGRVLVAGLALTTLTGCKPLDDAMVFVFGRSMRNQRSFDPYEHPARPPENSVPFAAGNLASAPGQVNVGQPEGVDVPRFTQMDLGVPGVGGEVIQGLTNPIPRDDAAAMARGRELYLRYCVVCHGEDGVGANAYIAQYNPLLASFNLSGAQVASYSDAYIYAMIRVGRALMPAYGPRIGHYDRWTVVNYVRQLQEQAGTFPVAQAGAPGAAPAPDADAPAPDADAPAPDDGAPAPDDGAPAPDDAAPERGGKAPMDGEDA